MVEVVIATRNPKKFRELKGLLAMPSVRYLSLSAFRRVPRVRETGRTFEANAIKKARLVAQTTDYLAIADDSGLEVAVLRGGPGVRSARFAGRHGDDRANYTKLLRLLEHLPLSKRTARFRCALALASPKRLLAVTNGQLVGRIAHAPKGHRGFGYDPVFIAPRLKQTIAQLSPTVKNQISHRAQAAMHMRRVLIRLLNARIGF